MKTNKVYKRSVRFEVLTSVTRRLSPCLQGPVDVSLIDPYQRCRDVSYLPRQGGRDSWFGTSTRYGLDVPGFTPRVGSRFSVQVQTGPGHHPTFCKMRTGSLSWGKVVRECLWPHTPSSCQRRARVQLNLCRPPCLHGTLQNNFIIRIEEHAAVYMYTTSLMSGNVTLLYS